MTAPVRRSPCLRSPRAYLSQVWNLGSFTLRYSPEFCGVDIVLGRTCLSFTVIWMTKLSPHNYPYQLHLTKLLQQLLLLVKQKPDIFFSEECACTYRWRHPPPPSPLCETVELTPPFLFQVLPCNRPALFKNTSVSFWVHWMGLIGDVWLLGATAKQLV